MRNQSVKGLLVAVVVLLLLNLAPQFSVSSAKEQATAQGRVVGVTSAFHQSPGRIYLFRVFEDGRTEVSSMDIQDENGIHNLYHETLAPAEPWSPLKMKDAENKPK